MSGRTVARALALLAIILVGAVLPARPVNAQDASTAASETLRWANRDIAVIRTTLAGAPPRARVRQAQMALHALDAHSRSEPVTLQTLTIRGQPASALLVGSRTILVLQTGDASLPGVPLDTEAERVRLALEAALEADRLQRQPQVVLQGVVKTLGWGLVAIAVLFGSHRLATWSEVRLQGVLEGRMKRERLSWGAYAMPLLLRIMVLLRWVLYAAVITLWLVVALESFPLTHPLGEGITAFYHERLALFGRSVVSATPGLATVVLIVFLTRAVVEGLRIFFASVQSGRIRVPWIHRETAGATRRLVSIGVWGIGLAIAYPYFPGSESEAFKGVSIFFGLMVTLGSAGVVTQLMSGLVVVYSRALRPGDLVQVGGQDARVVEVGALATKLVDVSRHEITIPNSVLVANSVRNYSRLGRSGPVYVSTCVTVSYAYPWRQIHRLLLQAAANVAGPGRSATPFVLQQALSEFYVRYEVFVPIDAPLDEARGRSDLISNLHAAIQDEFNRAGVQLMTPNFEVQPDTPIVVPPADWDPPDSVGK